MIRARPIELGREVAFALGAVRSAVRLAPAQATRPETPARFNAGALERLGLDRVTSPAGRIIARSRARRPLNAALSIAGIGWSVAILIVGRQLVDSVLYIADFQFGVVQRENVTLAFSAPRPGRIRYEVARLPGVMRSEPFRAVAARLRSDYRSRLVALLGIEPGSELRRPVDRRRNEREVPADGVVLDLSGCSRAGSNHDKGHEASHPGSRSAAHCRGGGTSIPFSTPRGRRGASDSGACFRLLSMRRAELGSETDT